MTGVNVSGRNLQFAEDTVLTATSSKQQQEQLESIDNTNSKSVGKKKTITGMAATKEHRKTREDIKKVQRVRILKYLVSR